MQKEKLNFHGPFGFRSEKRFWPFFIGAFLGLGYSSTKNILVSKIDTEPLNQENLNQSLSKEQSISFENSSSGIKKDKISQRDSTINYENKNPLNQLIKNKNNSIIEELTVPKKINIMISDNSYLSFTIEFSEKINNMNQPAYKKNLAFFQEQNVESLMQGLDKPKITKSSRVRAD